MLIENAPELFSDEIIHYGVARLLDAIFKACRLELLLPENLPEPDALQAFLEEQCRKYGE